MKSPGERPWRHPAFAEFSALFVEGHNFVATCVLQYCLRDTWVPTLHRGACYAALPHFSCVGVLATAEMAWPSGEIHAGESLVHPTYFLFSCHQCFLPLRQSLPARSTALQSGAATQNFLKYLHTPPFLRDGIGANRFMQPCTQTPDSGFIFNNGER